MKDKHVLTRALIEVEGMAAIIARDAPDVRLLTLEESAASLRATIAARPAGDAWLFGYGSLIWNPTIVSVEHRTARIEGWHREFCIATRAGRGSPDNPGLVLALDEGGSCSGVAFRIADEMLGAELAIVWRREMLTGVYIPRWLDILDQHGMQFGSALAFVADPTCAQYDGDLAYDAIVERLATASGALGTSADYLFHTCEGLRMRGIPDDKLDRLAAQVRAYQDTPRR